MEDIHCKYCGRICDISTGNTWATCPVKDKDPYKPHRHTKVLVSHTKTQFSEFEMYKMVRAAADVGTGCKVRVPKQNESHNAIVDRRRVLCRHYINSKNRYGQTNCGVGITERCNGCKYFEVGEQFIDENEYDRFNRVKYNAWYKTHGLYTQINVDNGLQERIKQAHDVAINTRRRRYIKYNGFDGTLTVEFVEQSKLGISRGID